MDLKTLIQTIENKTNNRTTTHQKNQDTTAITYNLQNKITINNTEYPDTKTIYIYNTTNGITLSIYQNNYQNLHEHLITEINNITIN